MKRHFYLDFTELLTDVQIHASKTDDLWPIHPVKEDLRLGFKDMRVKEEWLIRLHDLQSDPSPYKHYMHTQQGREQMAVGVSAWFFEPPGFIRRIDVEKTHDGSVISVR